MSISKLVIVILILNLANSQSRANTKVDLKNPSVLQWMQLMQYYKAGSGYKSKLKAPRFFISPNGMNDPETELKATVDLFRKAGAELANHPQCLYPARYQVLKASFNLAPSVFCKDYVNWKQIYGLSGASLFYAGPYLSSPSSVFGHAFLLLGSNRIEKFSQLTFNYAADIPEDVSTIDYAYNGLTGGFSGVISVMPYYQRLYQYTDMENRDLWEYELNLSPTELALLSDYIWELKQFGNFDYYFLDENCATILMWILKTIRPSIRINSTHGLFLSPPEITQILSREQFIKNVFYHPSLLKRLDSKINKMTELEKQQFRNAIDGPLIPNSETSPLVLETIMDHLNIERHRRSGNLPTDLKKFEQNILLLRSKIQKPPTEFNETETPANPNQLHPPMRFKAGINFIQNEWRPVFSFRPGVHSFTDESAGYLPYSNIQILEATVEIPKEKGPRLSELTIVNLSNYLKTNFYQNPISWSVDLHIKQNEFNDENNQLFAEVQLAGGYSTGPKSEDLIVYSLLLASVRTNQGRPLGTFDLGPQLGAIYRVSKIKFNLFLAFMKQFEASENTDFIKINFELAYQLSKQWTTSVQAIQFHDVQSKFNFEQSRVSLNYYF